MSVTLLKTSNLVLNLSKIIDPNVVDAFRQLLFLLQQQQITIARGSDSNIQYTVPTGTVYGICGGDVPPNHLRCNGAAVDRNQYYDLYNLIGTTFGSGDGNTTFNLPDIVGEDPIYIIHI